MKLDNGSFMLNMPIKKNGGTASWGTSLGQQQNQNYPINRIEASELYISMIYNGISDIDKTNISNLLGKNKDNKHEVVLVSMFKRVYVNNTLIPDAEFVIAIVREHTESHNNRLSLKYNVNYSYLNKNVNLDCVEKIKKKFNLADSCSWFVYDIDSKTSNQDSIFFKMIICDDYPAEGLIDSKQRSRYISDKISSDNKQIKPISVMPLNTILFGPPGTGKTYSTVQYALSVIENSNVAKYDALNRTEQMKRYNDYVLKGQIVFTTFHQNYAYEDFIEGIKPSVENGMVTFYNEDGILKRLALRALDDPQSNYVLIIDEINRGNISKVFGELITLIEEDKRWGEINELVITLPSGDSFVLPNNLYIIGTMNSADKSISLLDIALRRRFSFIEMSPRIELIEDKALQTFLTQLNNGLLSQLKSKDKLIGHSYFVGKTENDLCDILNQSIIPLIYDYFFDEDRKVQSCLDNALKGYPISFVDNPFGRIQVKNS